MFQRISFWFLLFLLFAPVGLPAFAQSQGTTGVIEGTVIDECGSPLAGVEMVLTNRATNYNISITSGYGGRFRALLLPLGPYRLVATIQGYDIAVQEGLWLTPGRTVNVTVKLHKKEIEEPELDN